MLLKVIFAALSRHNISANETYHHAIVGASPPVDSIECPSKASPITSHFEAEANKRADIDKLRCRPMGESAGNNLRAISYIHNIIVPSAPE